MFADWYPFYIGALFGFGAGIWFAYFLFGMPKIRAARKAARTRRMNELKEVIKNRINIFGRGDVYTTTLISAVTYYKKFSPSLFEGLCDSDVMEVIKDLESEGLETGFVEGEVK